MKTYRITIDMQEGESVSMDGWTEQASIVCDSIYTLDTDLVEWVRQEVDPNAQVTILGVQQPPASDTTLASDQP